MAGLEENLISVTVRDSSLHLSQTKVPRILSRVTYLEGVPPVQGKWVTVDRIISLVHMVPVGSYFGTKITIINIYRILPKYCGLSSA